MMKAVLRSCQLLDVRLTNTAMPMLTAKFHSSLNLNEKKKFPFEYYPAPVVPIMFASGDKEGLKTIDLGQPRLEFRRSKELETANEMVKKIFSLDFAPKKCTTAVFQDEFLKMVQKHKLDNFSFEAEISKLTVRIRRSQAHLKTNPKNGYLRQALKERIESRNRLLRHLRRVDNARFEWLTQKLKIAYIPPPSYSFQSTYARRMRELTQQYCEQIRVTRLQAYKNKLKARQADFLKEKEEKLKFIAEEEKALGLGDGTPLQLESELMKPKPPPVESTILKIARKVDETEETALLPLPPQHPRIDY